MSKSEINVKHCLEMQRPVIMEIGEGLLWEMLRELEISQSKPGSESRPFPQYEDR